MSKLRSRNSGCELLGLIGLLLAVPAAAVILTLVEEFTP